MKNIQDSITQESKDKNHDYPIYEKIISDIKSTQEKTSPKRQFSVAQRVSSLLDDPDGSLDIGSIAGYSMYEEFGGCPYGGVLVKIGKINGLNSIIVANDPNIKSGSLFPISVKKILRAQEISIANNLPIVYLMDCAGVFLPLQHEVFPDKNGFGRIFYNSAKISAKGIIQFAAILGSCVAGGAYLPLMCDETFICKESGFVFLGGPSLVKSAIGEETDKESLGGYRLHTEYNGTVDNAYTTEKECLEALSASFKYINKDKKKENKQFFYSNKIDNSYFNKENICTRIDIREIIEKIVDKDSILEYKENYGRTVVCCFAEIEGKPLGIIANQKKNVKTQEGEFQIGGVIYSDSAKKITSFINTCEQRNVAILFLNDVNGFMVGKKSESQGIIKEGAEILKIISNVSVPKISLIIGNSYGAGHYAMSSNAFDTNFTFAWPETKLSVMSSGSYNKTLSKISNISEENSDNITKSINEYHVKENIIYGASRMWIDEIILPSQTRSVLSKTLSTVSL